MRQKTNSVFYFSGRVISVACGYAHTLFLMESGVIYSCGNGSYGQLGIGVEIKKRFKPEAVPVPDKVIMIASKYFHCLAVSEGQKIYCWGANPQTLKMKMFVKRRLRAETDKSTSATGKRNDKLAINNDYLIVTEVEHMVCLPLIAKVLRFYELQVKIQLRSNFALAGSGENNAYRRRL